VQAYSTLKNGWQLEAILINSKAALLTQIGSTTFKL
jgi:hypothetical protein